MNRAIEVEVVEDVKIKGRKTSQVNVPWEMCRAVFPYLFWSAMAFLGFLAISQILDAIII